MDFTKGHSGWVFISRIKKELNGQFRGFGREGV